MKLHDTTLTQSIIRHGCCYKTSPYSRDKCWETLYTEMSGITLKITFAGYAVCYILSEPNYEYVRVLDSNAEVCTQVFSLKDMDYQVQKALNNLRLEIEEELKW